MLTKPSSHDEKAFSDFVNEGAIEEEKDGEARRIASTARRPPTSNGQQHVVAGHGQMIVEQLLNKAQDLRQTGTNIIIINELHIHNNSLDVGSRLTFPQR